MISVRPATPDDADGMSAVITPILRGWNSNRRGDAEHMLENYIKRPHSIRCSVATSEGGRIIGFQSLVLATKDNPHDTPVGWGIIGP